MRELHVISIASQLAVEKSVVKMLMKVVKGMAQRRFEREALRSAYRTWRAKAKRLRERALLQGAFRLLLKITTRKIAVLWENWAWEAGHARALARKCWVFAIGRTWHQSQSIASEDSRREIRQDVGGRAGQARISNLRRLQRHLAAWWLEACRDEARDSWRRWLVSRGTKHRVIRAWRNTAVSPSETINDARRIVYSALIRRHPSVTSFAQIEARCVRKSALNRLVWRQHYENMTLQRYVVLEWYAQAKAEEARIRQQAEEEEAIAKRRQAAAEAQTKREMQMELRASTRAIHISLHRNRPKHFDAWSEWVRQRQIERQLELRARRRVLQVLMHRTMPCYLGAWTEWVEGRRAERQLELRARRRMLQVLMHRTMPCYLGAWTEWVEGRRADRQLEVRARRRSHHRKQHVYLAVWMEWVREIRILDQKARYTS